MLWRQGYLEVQARLYLVMEHYTESYKHLQHNENSILLKIKYGVHTVPTQCSIFKFNQLSQKHSISTTVYCTCKS